MPALVALSHVDQADQDAVHRQLKAMPAKDKTFLTYGAGHGYGLLHQERSRLTLDPLAGRVLKLIKDGG
jgi:hypothetical protein